jgi:NADPH:quinone reductase-like Zn-dependent oxidoreductase
MVLQIAKAQGAFVATTCSGRNTDFVRKLGADRPIDYTKERCVGSDRFLQ